MGFGKIRKTPLQEESNLRSAGDSSTAQRRISPLQDSIDQVTGKQFLPAIHANRQFFQGHAGFFADIFQLIHGREITAAGITGLHLKSASPDLSLIFSCLHFNMTGGTDIGAGAAADAGIRFFIEGRTDIFMRTTSK